MASGQDDGVIMMSRGQVLVMFGFVVIIVGLSLLVGFNLSGGDAFFFVFPFFYGSASPIIVMALGMTFMAVMILMMMLMVGRSRNLPRSQGGAGPTFVPIAGQCTVCGSPLPQNATFCPHCGSPTHIGSGL